MRGQFIGSRMFPSSRIVTIGSGAESALVLDDPAVAARHAIVYVQGGQVLIADQSRRGVVINGRLVQQQAVTGLDEIELGQSRLKIEAIGALATAVPPAPPAPPGRIVAMDDLFTPAPEAGAMPLIPDDAELPPLPVGTPGPAVDSMFAPGFSSAELDQPTTRIAPERLAGDLRLGLGSESSTDQIRAERRPPPPAHDLEAEEVTRQGPRPRGLDVPTRPIGRAPEPPRAAPRPEPPREAPRPEPPREAPRPEPPREAPRPAARARPSEPPPRAERALPPVRPSLPPPPPVSDPGDPSGPVPAAPARAEASPPLGDVRASVPPEVEVPPIEELDEEELEEAEFEPPFSLLENVVRERFQAPIKSEARPVPEVIAYRNSRLLDVARLERGQRYTSFSPESGLENALFRAQRSGKVRLIFDEVIDGSVVIGGQTASLASLRTDEYRVSKKSHFAVDLSEGDFAHVRLHGFGYLVRFVRPPVRPEGGFDLRMGREDRAYFGLAVLGMLVMLTAIWLEAMIAPRELLAMEEEVQFAEVSLKDLELEKPEPEKPPEPEPEPPPPAPEPPPPAPEPEPKPTPKKRERVVQKRTVAPPVPTPPSAQEVKAAQAMAALQALTPLAANKNLSQAVSNIAAVRVPAGTSRQFKVSGAIGKIAGNEISLATGTGGRETRAAAKIIQEGEVGKLTGGGGTGKVRGKVERMPARQVGTQGGFLDRNEILKVINAGIPDIQRCYERALMKNPGLAGKVVFDWVIAPSGGVSSTRVRSSSLASEEVASCIGQVIKGWMFKSPQGGSVTVTYPFVFSVQGF